MFIEPHNLLDRYGPLSIYSFLTCGQKNLQISTEQKALYTLKPIVYMRIIGMIIIEGVDNTGKTTLTRLLAKDLGLEVIQSPSHLRGCADMYRWVDDEIAKQPLYPAIYDRFPLISEMVYGPILRGSTPKLSSKYNGWAQDANVLFIYCRPPLHKILEWGNREQMDGVKEHVKLLVRRYDKVMLNYKTRGWGVVRYDYNEMDAYCKVRSLVKLYINDYRSRRNTER